MARDLWRGARRLRRRAERSADAGESAADAAATVRALGVLLQAGAGPQQAWRHLAASGDGPAKRIAARCDDGAELVAAIQQEGDAWADVAAAWEVATLVGAPLADTLRAMSEALQDAASAQDDVRIALAEPTGTARLLLWLPFAGLLLGFVLGFDTFDVLMRNPLGIGCVLAGVALVILARWWTHRLVARARPKAGVPGMHAELVAIALAGGTSIPRALQLAERSRGRGLARSARTEAALELSRAAGVPARQLLRASAAQARHEARVRGRVDAAKLSSALLLPLGVCTLPAFLLLGVAPLMLAVLGSTPLPF